MARGSVAAPPASAWGISGSAYPSIRSSMRSAFDVPGHIVELLAPISTCILRSVSWPVSIATRTRLLSNPGTGQTSEPRGAASRHGLVARFR